MKQTNSLARPHLLLLPYPGRGHINPMLNLAHHLTSRGLLVTVVVTEEWLSILADCEEARGVRLRTIPDVLPSERSRGADYAAFIEAVLTRMAAPVTALVGGLEEQVDAIVADSMLPWAALLGRNIGVPVAAFFPQSAAVFAALEEMKRVDGQPEVHCSGKGNEFLKYLPRPSSSHFTDFISDSSGRSIVKTFIAGISWFSAAQGILFNSYTDLETVALNDITSRISVPTYSIGPATPKSFDDVPSSYAYYNFLDSQPNNSVLYVSLGSFLPVSSEQIKEIAVGLTMSGRPFIWSIRDSEHVVKLIGDKGMVVPWCDQIRVLCHPSVGGFLTHCGWNSTLEGLHAAVPMLTYPLMWDQFSNSKLIVDDWKVGLRVKDEKEEGIVKGEEITKVVQRLMDMKTDENKELRGRATKFQEKSRIALAEKGSSRANVIAFIDDLVKSRQHNHEGAM